MPTIDVTVTCPVFTSFRVQQVAGMFDVPLADRASQRFQVELEPWNEPWKIGLIVGPSGSGKTTIARQMFGDRLSRRTEWASDRAVIDGLGDWPIKEITGLFTAVGFSSPPSWIKPYGVLSNGEQFRCDLARALAEARAANTSSDSGPPPLVAFDEFTSVVDRNVARAVSAAIAKGIQRGQIHCRFVAVTCHYDVTEWLQPDWVIDMATSTFQRRCLPRPSIELALFRCARDAWKLFARHHYLSSDLPKGARCFLALWDGEPISFCSTMPIIGRSDHYRFARLVTLPDYQGLGIGAAVLEACAELHRAEGHRVSLTASHPAVLGHCRRSARWRAVDVKKAGSTRSQWYGRVYQSSAGRAVVSFEYVGLAH